MKTALVWHEKLMWFQAGAFAGPMPAGGWIEPGEASESPEAKRRIKNLLDACGMTRRLDIVTPEAATDTDILRVHGRAYLDRVKELSAAYGGQLGASAFIGPGGYELALLAAGASKTAFDLVLEGRARSAYAMARPPGHHAEPDGGMGFCVFGNIAVAARHAIERHGLTRIAVVDWDVHHGNGTQACFYDDPRVLAISLHQDRLFPQGNSGTVEQTGTGKGRGARSTCRCRPAPAQAPIAPPSTASCFPLSNATGQS